MKKAGNNNLLRVHGRFLGRLYGRISESDNSVSNAWNAVYHNDVKPLSRLEESNILVTNEVNLQY